MQLLLDGVLVGAIFALVAYGMALVWGVMDIINIAQGELVMLGGYAACLPLRAPASTRLLRVPVAAAVLFVLGWLLYRRVIFRVVDRDLFISILATFGLSILLQQLANTLFGADIRTAESGLRHPGLLGGAVTVARDQAGRVCRRAAHRRLPVLFLKRSADGPGDPRHRAERPRGPRHGHRHRPRLRLDLRR